MTNEEHIQKLYPGIRQPVRALLQEIANNGIKGGIFAGIRTYSEQDLLYAKGRTIKKDARGNKLQIVTNARGGGSFHNFGVAIDWVFFDKKGNWTWNGPYDAVVKIVKAMGFESGADFYYWEFGRKKALPDKPHIQMSYGQDIRKLDYIYQHAGKSMLAVWSYLNEQPK